MVAGWSLFFVFIFCPVVKLEYVKGADNDLENTHTHTQQRVIENKDNKKSGEHFFHLLINPHEYFMDLIK
jgi:hypothetical protein